MAEESPKPGEAGQPAKTPKPPKSRATKPRKPSEPRTGPGLVRRLATTPIRDLARARVSGRLDVKSLLDKAALPDRLRGIVAEVVRRTRLWRPEKADVAPG